MIVSLLGKAILLSEHSWGTAHCVDASECEETAGSLIIVVARGNASDCGKRK